MTTPSTSETRRYPGRWFIVLGFGFTGLGIAVYLIQIYLSYLKAPRYLPITGLLGVICVALALWQARSFWRVFALVLLLLVAGAEIVFLVKARLPAYTSAQVATGKPFPAFKTTKADGSPFTQRDLNGDQDTVMVFFRGRW